MPKKVFDPYKMKNSGSSNIELRMIILVNKFDIQNRALKVSFDLENMICGNFLDAKEGF